MSFSKSATSKIENITLALAGIMQSVVLVKELAQTGKLHENSFETSIYSIFQTNPKDVSDVYGSISSIKLGLKKLIEIMGPANPDPTSTRYMLSLIHLQKKLYRSTQTMKKLSERIQQIKKQSEYFSLTHATVITNLADIYLNAISPFGFKIIIWGNQRILGAAENMDRVRSLLLAGIRSVVLWRQVGGSRLQFIFSRAKIRKTAQKFLMQIERNINS